MTARVREEASSGNYMEPRAEAVIDRLMTVMDAKNDHQLSKKAGVAQTTISTWRKRNVVPYGLCARISQQHAISLDWLVFGAELGAATKATDEVLKRVAEAVTSNPGPHDDGRNARMQALFRARPEIMAILTQSGAFSEAQIGAMVANTGTMTVQILAEVAEVFDIPLDVLVYGKSGSDYAALVYGLGFALSRVTGGLMPEFAGVRLFEEGQEPHLRNKRAEQAWHMAVVHHLAGVVEHFYDCCLQQRFADPDVAFGR